MLQVCKWSGCSAVFRHRDYIRRHLETCGGHAASSNALALAIPSTSLKGWAERKHRGRRRPPRRCGHIIERAVVENLNTKASQGVTKGGDVSVEHAQEVMVRERAT